jgi:uncharacterized membrane protein
MSVVPIRGLQFVVGVLTLLFGLRWLRKAILRAGGIIALHDEDAAFARETRELSEAGRRGPHGFDWVGGSTAFKIVLMEGIEVAFIVIAVGAGRGLLGLASAGALAACVVVAAVGAALHRLRGAGRAIRRDGTVHLPVLVWRVLASIGPAATCDIAFFCAIIAFGWSRFSSQSGAR